MALFKYIRRAGVARPIVSPHLLGRAGSVIYGEHWIAPLARALKVSPRTVQRWLAGQNEIPQSIGSDLRALLIYAASDESKTLYLDAWNEREDRLFALAAEIGKTSD